jgi:hypothetical protein
MVTHGYVVYKYEGIHYIFYNHSDSYPEHLGNLVVQEIQHIISNNKVPDYKALLRRIPLQDESGEGELNICSIEGLLYSYDSYSYYTSDQEPGNEWVYILDLDTNKFIITDYYRNRYIFNLKSIREDWMHIVHNGNGYEEESEEEELEEPNEHIEICENDTEEDISLKIKILQANVKIYKLKLLLNKKHA